MTITDTYRIDFLERAGSPGLKWIARPSVTGRGYRVHQCPRLGEYDTAREAIDAAIEIEDERDDPGGPEAGAWADFWAPKKGPGHPLRDAPVVTGCRTGKGVRPAK